MKTNIGFFSHDTEAHRNHKLRALRSMYGWEGYGRFWALNEMIGESENCILDISTSLKKGAIAADLGMNIPEFDEFIFFMGDTETCGLLTLLEDEKVTTARAQEDLERVMKNRIRKRVDSKEEETARRNGKSTRRFNKNDEINIDSKSSLKNSNNSTKNKSTRRNGKTACHFDETARTFTTDRNRQEQTRLDKNSAADSINLGQKGESCASSDSAADFLSSEILEKRCKAATGLYLKPPEVSAILELLAAQNLGEAFLESLFGQIKKIPNVKKPAGFLKHTLLNLGDFPDFVEDFRRARASPPKPKLPKLPVCFCTGELRVSDDVCQCTSCGAMWEILEGSWKPIPKEEVADITGIFKKKSAFQTGIPAN